MDARTNNGPMLVIRVLSKWTFRPDVNDNSYCRVCKKQQKVAATVSERQDDPTSKFSSWSQVGLERTASGLKRSDKL